MGLIERTKIEFSNILNRVLFSFHSVPCGKGMRSNGIVFIYNKGKMKIGTNFTVNSSDKANPIGCGKKCYFQIFEGGNISIGNNVGMSCVAITSRCSIIIEDKVLLGAGVKIFDTDFHRLCRNEDILSAPIVIKEEAFIGANSIILKGVTIGKGAVIGAGSVVTKSIPDFEVWAGNPARFIRSYKYKTTCHMNKED